MPEDVLKAQRPPSKGGKLDRAHCCCICGKDLTGTSWLCNECAIRVGVPGTRYADWPAWLKELVNAEQRERRWEKGAPLEASRAYAAEREMYGEGDIGDMPD